MRRTARNTVQTVRHRTQENGPSRLKSILPNPQAHLVREFSYPTCTISLTTPALQSYGDGHLLEHWQALHTKVLPNSYTQFASERATSVCMLNSAATRRGFYTATAHRKPHVQATRTIPAEHTYNTVRRHAHTRVEPETAFQAAHPSPPPPPFKPFSNSVQALASFPFQLRITCLIKYDCARQSMGHMAFTRDSAHIP